MTFNDVIAAAASKHDVHVDSALCPVRAEYLPAGQFVQAVCPMKAEYLPAGQSVQTLPLPAYLPAAQLPHTVAPAAEYLPGSQFVQSEEAVPAVALNLPAAQFVHTDAAAAAHVPAAQAAHGPAPAGA